MKSYSEFEAMLRAGPAWEKATPEQINRANEVIREYESVYVDAMSGKDIEQAYKLFYRFGSDVVKFAGAKSIVELIESIYGDGAVARRSDEKRAKREEEERERQRVRIEKQRESELSERVGYEGKVLTIREWIDALIADGYSPVLIGKGISARWQFNHADGCSYTLNKPIFRRKYVMEYIASVSQREMEVA